MEVTVRTDGKVWYQRYDRGIPEEDVKEIGVAGKDEHGTTVKFKADYEIFETLVYDYNTLKNRLKELASVSYTHLKS